jgi:hypothetical protein
MRVVRLKAVSVVVRAHYLFYEEPFNDSGSLESGLCHFSRALSRFMRSCLTRVVGVKAVSIVFARALSRFMKSCLMRVVRLKAVSVVFCAHYRVL